MATRKLDDRIAKTLPGPPRDGKRAHLVYYDSLTTGLGVRVTKNLHRAWILNFRVRGGQERRLTIGDCADWPIRLARAEAQRLRRIIDVGGDPMADRREQRTAPTVADLCSRYLAEHAIKKRTKGDDELFVRQWLLPELGTRKLADVRLADVEKLHRKISVRTPIRANRAIALLSKMMSLAIRWEMRPEPNPCKGLQKNLETSRERYLSGDELGRLTKALDAYPVEAAANAIRLLLLTGSRRGEVLGAKWSEFDLDRGTWRKPPSRTKTKRTSQVPLSGAALTLLSEMRALRGVEHEYVFPRRGGHMGAEIKAHWLKICRAAELDGLRMHDLRHSFASILVNGGASLQLVGKLLGHTKVTTTDRYAHLLDSSLRVAVEAVGEVVTGAKPAPG